MRARDHQSSIGLPFPSGIIQHGSRPQADPLDGQTARHQPPNQGGFQVRRANPTIIADAHAPPPLAHHQRPKGAAQRPEIRRIQGVSNHTTNVIFAQNGRVETVRFGHS